MENFVRNLKKYFKESGLTFEEFEVITGLPRSSLNRWTNGKVKAPVAVVPTLEKGLNLEPGTLLDLCQVSEKEKSLLSAYRKQPEKQPEVDHILGIDEPAAPLSLHPQEHGKLIAHGSGQSEAPDVDYEALHAAHQAEKKNKK